MLASLTTRFTAWVGEVNSLISDQVIDLDPHEYCIGAVVVIAIGCAVLKR